MPIAVATAAAGAESAAEPGADRTLPPRGDVRVFHRDVRYPVRIVDVSPEGARLRHEGRLPPDAWVTIRYRHLSIRARVIWSDDGAARLQFPAPLPPAALVALRTTAPARLVG